MLILASASPRRRQLLQGLGLSFDVLPQNCEEMSNAALPQDYVTQIALQKARSALKGAGEGDVVLAADTEDGGCRVLFLPDEVKPGAPIH